MTYLKRFRWLSVLVNSYSYSFLLFLFNNTEQPEPFLVLTFLPCPPTVPLRAPELSLTSNSPMDIQVSWQPLPEKLSRGRVSAYRLAYRTSAENAISQVELPGDKTQHLLENLQPDTIYLLRIVAATSVGWGEQSAWTSHRTPKASSARGTTFGRVALIIYEIADV